MVVSSKSSKFEVSGVQSVAVDYASRDMCLRPCRLVSVYCPPDTRRIPKVLASMAPLKQIGGTALGRSYRSKKPRNHVSLVSLMALIHPDSTLPKAFCQRAVIREAEAYSVPRSDISEIHEVILN